MFTNYQQNIRREKSENLGQVSIGAPFSLRPVLPYSPHQVDPLREASSWVARAVEYFNVRVTETLLPKLTGNKHDTLKRVSLLGTNRNTKQSQSNCNRN